MRVNPDCLPILTGSGVNSYFLFVANRMNVLQLRYIHVANIMVAVQPMFKILTVLCVLCNLLNIFFSLSLQNDVQIGTNVVE